MLHKRALVLTAFLSGALLLSSTPACALDPLIANTQYSASSWLSDDGLPQNWIGAIAQTPDGYLWFATEEGVARYDGTRFTTFLERKSIGALLVTRDGSLWISVDFGLARYKDHKMTLYSTRDGLREGPISSMSEGADGSIWMATRAGLNRYYQGKFSAFTIGDGSAATWIWSTTVTSDGSLWWGTNGNGLKRLSNGVVTTFTTSDGLADNIVFAIRQDHHGDLWIGTNNGLSRMHDGKITTVPKTDGLTNQCVKVIREDRDRNLWIGTDGGGLNRYAGGKFTSFGTQHRLSSASVLSLLEDREGSLWVGTSGLGVTQLRPSKFITIGRSEGLNAEMVWAVREAADGSLLIGTNHGFWRWKEGAAVTSLTVREGLSSDVVRSVMEDRHGGIWLGTNEGVNYYQHGKVTVYGTSSGLPNNTIRTTIEDRQGNIWIGTRGGGLVRYRDGVFKAFNRTNGLAGDLLGNIAEDRDGSLWVSTDGGVSVLKDGVFTNYSVRDGLSTNSVRVIHHDRQGSHWIGTYGGGLNRIKNGRIAHISVIDGLFDEVVFAIVEDRKGYLWMTCNRGVFRVSIRELNDFVEGRVKRVHSTAFDITDGMKAAECNGGAPGAWEGRDGRFYFATVRGVAIIDPNHIPLNAVAPPVLNEEVLLDEKAQDVSSGLVVGPGRHSLEIHYTALSLVSPKRVAFRYRLRGFSDAWVEAGNRRTAFYTNLPPGNYVFEVMGSNNDGVWSAASNPLRFRFEAAFYQTYSFRIACVLLLLLAAWAAFKMRLRLLKERERILIQCVDEQTAELKAAKESAEKAAEDNLRLNRSKQLILNSASEGIFGLGDDGIATFVNPSAARMLGWPVEELVGKNLHLLVHEDIGMPASLCSICGGEPPSATMVSRTANFRARNGRTFPVEYAAGAIAGDQGERSGVVVTFRDVTERRAVEQLKSEFVSTVSHELRTPLTSIRGALGLLGSGLLGPIAEKGQRMLEIAVTNTDRLVRLINDILDLERMASGRVELSRGAVDAQNVLVQAAEGLQAIAEEARVRIVIEPVTGTLWGDSDRIIQTLTNLLGNAIKFSPRQTTVTLSGTAQETSFTFCVTDQGRGVPEEKVRTIFERFSQVDTSDSRDKGGSGLGLAICQSIVTAHGGRIWVEKNEPAGSRFQFTIPLAVANQEEDENAA